MKTTNGLPTCPCPQCGYKMDSATAISGEHVPKPGDLSLCLGCAAYLTFDDDLRLVAFPEVQLLDLPDDVRLELTQTRKMIVAHSVYRDQA